MQKDDTQADISREHIKRQKDGEKHLPKSETNIFYLMKKFEESYIVEFKAKKNGTRVTWAWVIWIPINVRIPDPKSTIETSFIIVVE